MGIKKYASRINLQTKCFFVFYASLEIQYNPKQGVHNRGCQSYNTGPHLVQISKAANLTSQLIYKYYWPQILDLATILIEPVGTSNSKT